MEIKVRAVGATEEKSVQQVEQELLEKHEQKLEGTEPEQKETPKVQVQEETTIKTEPKVEEPKVEKEEIKTQSSELKEEDVLKFIGNRYGKEIKSLDELQQQREEEPLPEDVSKYLQYKKETGRGFDDFVKLNKDYKEMDDDLLLKEYLTATEKGLDAEDILDLMDDFTYDEDVDDEKEVKKIKLKKKKTIAKARDYFSEQQEKYRVPLESRRDSSPREDEEEFQAYRQYIAEAKTVQEQNARKGEMFQKKTDDVFSEFKGFEFTLEDNKVYFSPGDAAELKKAQLSPQNFINKFLDEEGLINDAAGYHRSLAMAMHPDKFAKFFYEQGKSAAADETMKKLKNVNMSTRNAPEVTKSNSGLQIKSLSPDSGRGLKIRSRNK
jgi:hypothetical protein